MWIRALKPGRAFLAGSIVLLALGFLGCGDPDPEPSSSSGKKARQPAAAPAKESANKVNIGQNIWLEVAGAKRRVLVSAQVCLRKGQLEHFMTRKGQKEHEAIVAADIDARKLHQALILAGAEPGSPVQFEPRFRPPTGSLIQVSVIYTDKGVKKVVPARSWIRNGKTGKELDTDWVFAGSMLVENPLDPSAPKRYLANDGDVICVANFPAALLDVPFRSAAAWSERFFEAWTERIPELDTKVVVALEVLPVPEKKP
jgi:hypothetical protein